jgi:chaperonin GroES
VIPPSVKKGQIVIFSKYGPDEVKIGGKEYYILSESSILAVIE